MKSRKVKAAARSKAFMSKKKLKGNVPLESDSDADVDSDSLLYDENRDGKDNELSTDDELIRHDEVSDEEEEVLPITDDEDDDHKDEKEDSEYDEEQGLPNKEAWGSKKSMYYSADFVDEDRGKTYREEDAENARAEAEEAFAMQRSVSSIAANSTMEILQLQTTDEPLEVEPEEEVNLESLGIKHKLKYIKKKCPELLLYIDEFKDKLSELKDKLVPLLELVSNGTIQSESCANYIKLKYQTLLHYCMNLSFYMVLKSSGPVLSNHPVLQRINSFKNLLDRMDNTSEKFNKEIDFILEKVQRNEEILFVNDKLPNKKSKNQQESIIEKLERIAKIESLREKKLKSTNKQLDTETEKEIFSLYMDLKKQGKEKDSDSEDEKMDEDVTVPEEMVTEEKRTITYQIAKNKGLIAKRKKEHRNPRVHNRIKFRKAQIRRKGQVRQVVREVKRYDGERTGISTHVVKSIKMK